MTIPWLKIIFGMAGVGALVAAGLHSCHPDPAIKAATDSASTAAAQDQVDKTVPGIAEQSATKTLHIEVNTKGAADAVQSAAGANTPVPPDVLRDWALGVDRVRAQALTAHAGPAVGQDPSGLPQSVPTP